MSTVLAAAVLPLAASHAAPRLTPEAELAKTLEGRTAGKPVNCISLNRVRGSRIIDDTAIVYDAGGTLYVNRPRSGAESLDRWDTLVTRLHSNRLCSIDVVRLYDSSSRMETGFVLLGDFVPYRRDAAMRAD
jgi:hypothetical protein